MFWKTSEYLNLVEMSELGRSYFGEGELSDPEFLRWQYLDNPNGRVIGYVARNEAGKIIGQYVVAPISIRCEQQILPASFSLNTLTHPEYFGQGIFVELGKMAYKKCSELGIALTYGFPNPNAYAKKIKYLNFSDIGHLKFYVWPLNTLNMLKATVKLPVTAMILKCLLDPMVRTMFPVSKLKEGSTIEIAEISRFEESYREFWQRYRDNYMVIIDRSVEHMNWRYFNVPRRKYRVFLARSKGRVEACMVLRQLEIKGIQTGLIVDLLVDHSSMDIDCGLMLLKKALEIFQAEKADLVGCLLPKHTREADILNTVGFISCPRLMLPQPFALTLGVHVPMEDSRRELLFDLKNWFLTMGDYDIG